MSEEYMTIRMSNGRPVRIKVADWPIAAMVQDPAKSGKLVLYQNRDTLEYIVSAELYSVSDNTNNWAGQFISDESEFWKVRDVVLDLGLPFTFVKRLFASMTPRDL